MTPDELAALVHQVRADLVHEIAAASTSYSEGRILLSTQLWRRLVVLAETEFAGLDASEYAILAAQAKRYMTGDDRLAELLRKLCPRTHEQAMERLEKAREKAT